MLNGRTENNRTDANRDGRAAAASTFRAPFLRQAPGSLAMTVRPQSSLSRASPTRATPTAATPTGRGEIATPAAPTAATPTGRGEIATADETDGPIPQPVLRTYLNRNRNRTTSRRLTYFAALPRHERELYMLDEVLMSRELLQELLNSTKETFHIDRDLEINIKNTVRAKLMEPNAPSYDISTSEIRNFIVQKNWGITLAMTDQPAIRDKLNSRISHHASQTKSQMKRKLMTSRVINNLQALAKELLSTKYPSDAHLARCALLRSFRGYEGPFHEFWKDVNKEVTRYMAMCADGKEDYLRTLIDQWQDMEPDEFGAEEGEDASAEEGIDADEN